MDMLGVFEACLKLVHGWALPQVTKARRGEAARTYRVGWTASAALGFVVMGVIEFHESAVLVFILRLDHPVPG